MSNKLENYNQKRDFNITSEPSGEIKKTKKDLRFVIQHHLASRDHFDFRLEWEGTLKSWAVPKGPSYNPNDKRLAVEVEDHPLSYRNFEGTIPKGQYGGGTVMVWDEGNWEPLENPSKGFKEGSIKFVLTGKRLKGKWTLVRMKDNNWLLIKEKDSFSEYTNINQFTTSIKTGRTMQEITEGKVKKSKSSVQSASDKCIIESVIITNPDKLVFNKSKITKEDIALYYQKISSRILPFLKKRIISVIRCPDGKNGSCFYKKHLGTHNKGINAIEIPNDSGNKEDYYYIKNILGLITEIQMNTVEFHTWGSIVDNLEKPDVMIFDLDPDEKMDLKEVRQGVRDLKSILDQLALVSFLKTSGGKGYHIVVPLKPSASWKTIREFSKNIAKVMEEKWPERYVSNVRKVNRKNKIFIDWIRNTRGATNVAPYSVRTKKNGQISMPIAWKELDKIAPDEITMSDAIKRLRRKDPWADFFHINQQLK